MKKKFVAGGPNVGKDSPACDNAGGMDISKEKESKAMKKTASRLKLKALEEVRHGLYIPLTPRTVEKRWRTKERIRKITAILKVSPRVFERGGGVAKAWRVRPSACESRIVNKIREKLRGRKAGMKVFSSKKIFDRILEVSETEEKVEDPVKASIAGKFEYMARELIDRTAYLQAREQHGVWSRTGISYACLGAPALNRPTTAPLPQLDKLQDNSFAIYPFNFFPIPSNIRGMLELAGNEVLKRRAPQYIIRREAIMKAARKHATMSNLLMKMGLLHLHDMDNARFPQDQILLTESLKRKVEKGGSWLEGMREGMMNAVPRALSVIPTSEPMIHTVEDSTRNSEHFRDMDLPSSKALIEPEIPLEVDWKTDQAFICQRIEALLFTTKGRRPPTTKHIWKIAEKHHPLKRKEDAPVCETEIQSIDRFYERVCRFTDLQKMADPLMDILIYFLKEIFEVEGLVLQPEVLLRLCERLASIPEEVVNFGRMICIMPILEFIAKELHITSDEFGEYITRSKIDQMQSDVITHYTKL